MRDSLGAGGEKGSEAWNRDTAQAQAQLRSLVQKAHWDAAWLPCGLHSDSPRGSHRPQRAKCPHLPARRGGTITSATPTATEVGHCAARLSLNQGHAGPLPSKPSTMGSLLPLCLPFPHCFQVGSPGAPHLTGTPPSLCLALFLEGPFLKPQFDLQNTAQALCPLQGLPQSAQSWKCAVFPCRLLQFGAGLLLWAPLWSGLTSSPYGGQCKTSLC